MAVLLLAEHDLGALSPAMGRLVSAAAGLGGDIDVLVAGQNAANARLVPSGTDRTAFLAAVAARWEQLDPAEYPFVHQVATQLREHDDREQFLAGIDLILAGIATVR